jgi:hypothetical protein
LNLVPRAGSSGAIRFHAFLLPLGNPIKDGGEELTRMLPQSEYKLLRAVQYLSKKARYIYPAVSAPLQG